MQSFTPNEIIVIDSSSSDGTADLARELGCKTLSIERNKFDHGGTRNLAAAYSSGEFLVFMTQDASLAKRCSLEHLLHPFRIARIAGVCGRQLPMPDANPLAAHARIFNYPPVSCVKNEDDIPKLGIKVPFLSNSFAAYRRTVFQDLGGFPAHIVFGEDMHIAARMIMKGYSIAYMADATAYHSHNYTIIEEFKRYFDLGSFHEKYTWIQEKFGKAGSEGFRFMRSELSYARKYGFSWVARSFLASGFKYIAYMLGRRAPWLPCSLKLKLGQNKVFWSQTGERR